MLGKLPRPDVLDQYRWADVFVFTSLRDTTGTVVLEALAAGLPVICLDHQGAHDVVTEQCGIKIPLARPGQMIDGLRDAMVALARDPDRRRRLRPWARAPKSTCGRAQRRAIGGDLPAGPGRRRAPPIAIVRRGSAAMNKAFVREPDHTADYCPRCGAKGEPVASETLACHVPEGRKTFPFGPGQFLPLAAVRGGVFRRL